MYRLALFILDPSAHQTVQRIFSLHEGNQQTPRVDVHPLAHRSACDGLLLLQQRLTAVSPGEEGSNHTNPRPTTSPLSPVPSSFAGSAVSFAGVEAATDPRRSKIQRGKFSRVHRRACPDSPCSDAPSMPSKFLLHVLVAGAILSRASPKVSSLSFLHLTESYIVYSSLTPTPTPPSNSR